MNTSIPTRFRDLRALADRAGVLPWWTQDDPVKNPQVSAGSTTSCINSNASKLPA